MTQDLSKTLDPAGKDVTEIIIEEHRLVDALGDRFKTETNMKEKQGQRTHSARTTTAHSHTRTLHPSDPSSHPLSSASHPCVPPSFPRSLSVPQALRTTSSSCCLSTQWPRRLRCTRGCARTWPTATKRWSTPSTSTRRSRRTSTPLDQMTVDQPGYDAQLMKALQDTLHHVQEEEGELLPEIKAKSSPEELEQMRTEFLRAHAMAPSRPHPSAPTNPPANKIAAAATHAHRCGEGRGQVLEVSQVSGRGGRWTAVVEGWTVWLTVGCLVG